MDDKLNYKRKSYTVPDYYMYYKLQIEKDTVYDISYLVYRLIVEDYFKYLMHQMMEESREIKLPCRLGTLLIIKHKPKEYTGKSLRWDWKATKEAGKPVYHLNEHSDEFKFRWHWNKLNCIIPNKIKYLFIASRANKRNLCQIIKNRVHDYVEK